MTEHIAAKPKGQRAPQDQPVQQPMRGERRITKAPSTDQKKIRRKMQRTATELPVEAWRLNPGDYIRGPNNQVVQVRNVRNHKTDMSKVYLDTEAGTLAVPRNQNFTMVPQGRVNRQQELPTQIGLPGGNSNTLPGAPNAGGMSPGEAHGTHKCPIDGSNMQLRNQGGSSVYVCPQDGYTMSAANYGFGGSGVTTDPNALNSLAGATNGYGYYRSNNCYADSGYAHLRPPLDHDACDGTIPEGESYAGKPCSCPCHKGKTAERGEKTYVPEGTDLDQPVPDPYIEHMINDHGSSGRRMRAYWYMSHEGEPDYGRRKHDELLQPCDWTPGHTAALDDRSGTECRLCGGHVRVTQGDGNDHLGICDDCGTAQHVQVKRVSHLGPGGYDHVHDPENEYQHLSDDGEGGAQLLREVTRDEHGRLHAENTPHEHTGWNLPLEHSHDDIPWFHGKAFDPEGPYNEWPKTSKTAAAACEGCGQPLGPMDGGYKVCMDCTKARHRAVMNGNRCSCGSKARPGEPNTYGRVQCQRCLGAIRQKTSKYVAPMQSAIARRAQQVLAQEES